MDVRFTPQMYINHYAAQRDISVKDIGVAPIVVISWAPSVIQALADSTGAQPAPLWPWSERYLFYTGQVQGRPVSFAQVGIGAPNTVTAMEEMIACGARLFLGLGWAGSLQPRAPVGTFLIPTSCIREEGTSPHYLDDDVAITPDSRLAELLQAAAQAETTPVFLGPQWTTDAPYREFCAKIDAYRQRGVLGVDMETSAMYALGLFRGVAVCNLLVVSDELWQEWNPAFRTPELKAATQRAQRIVLRVLADDALEPGLQE
jgi:uridine phosphorylase